MVCLYFLSVANACDVSDRRSLGDIVVSGEYGVIQYDFTKEEANNNITPRHLPRPPSPTLLEAIKRMEVAEYERVYPWVSHISRAVEILGFGRPSEETDILTTSTKPHRRIKHPQDPKRIEGQPRVFIGSIASSNTLLKDPTKRDTLRDKFGVKAVEMEASGVADATWIQESGFLIVRGICDYCDHNKNDIWQEYAAIVAASYTKALLESIPAKPVDQQHENSTNPSTKLPQKEKVADVENYLPRKVYKNQSKKSKTSFFFDKEREVGEDFSKIVENQHRTILLADGGAGKTTELQHLRAYYSKKCSAFYPFYINLRKYTNKDLSFYLPPHWENIPENQLLLFLDGLDEIEDKNKNDAIRQIEEFADKHKNAHIIVSCRTNFYRTEEDQLPGTLEEFSPHFLLELTSKDIDNYLTQNLTGDKAKFNYLVEINKIRSLISLPFYLINLVKLFNQTNTLPRNKSQLFEQLLALRFKEDTKKFKNKIDLKEDRNKILDSLEQLALVMETSGKNYILDEEFEALIPKKKLRRLIAHCSIWTKSEGQTTSWQFEHKNFQEYLAAKLLAKQNIEIIKQFVLIDSESKKINPYWITTFSFLISSLENDSNLFNELLNLTKKNQSELIAKFELDKIDNDTRTTFFRGVFNFYKNKRLFIDTSKYNIKELANFCQSDDDIDYLISESEQAKKDKNYAPILTAIILLANLQTEHSRQQKLTAFLLSCAFGNELGSEIQEQAIITITRLNLLTTEITANLLDSLKPTKDSRIRNGLYYLLHQQNLVEQNINFILEGTSFLVDYSSDENLLLALEKATSPQSVKTILTYFSDKPAALQSRSFDSRKAMNIIAQNAIQAYKEDEYILSYMAVLLVKQSSLHFRDLSQEIVHFFNETNTKLVAFKCLFLKRDLLGKEATLSAITSLAGLEEVEFVAQQYRENNISHGEINLFHYNLPNIEIRNHFANLVSKASNNKIFSEPEDKPTNPNKEVKTHQEKIQEYINLLFDKNTFIQEITKVFSLAKKKTLTSEDFFEIYKENHKEENIPNIIMIFLRPYLYSDSFYSQKKLYLSKFIKEINKWDWDWFFTYNIFFHFKDEKKLSLTPPQKDCITNWCYSWLTKVNFKTGVAVKNGEVETYETHTLLWFFLRKLKLEYPKEVLLDMLSFDDTEKNTSSGINEYVGISYLEEYLEKDCITKRILENLQKGIQVDIILENHVNYCKKHRLKEAIPLLQKELPNNEHSDHSRELCLETILELAKSDSIPILEQILPDITGQFKWKVVDKLVEHKSKACYSYLQKIHFDNNSDKLHTASYLIAYDDTKGLELFVDLQLEWSNENKTVLVIAPKSSPLETLHKSDNPDFLQKSIPHLIKLLDIAYKTKNDYLATAICDTLTIISTKSKECYLNAKASLQQFITTSNNFGSINRLEYFISKLERSYDYSKSQRPPFLEAKSKVDKLICKKP